MKKRKVDVAIIGGGPAGLAAATAAKNKGAQVLVIERNERLGGILNQCIHEGFGIEIYKETLTGPEYAQKEIDKTEGIECLTGAMVLELSPEKKMIVVSPEGLMEIQAEAIVLAMGCRERTRGNISIPGTRPAGVYTAGCAQNLMNLRNHMVGRDIVVLGSGDIGLIMARRLTLEGARVHAVVEILPYSSGLPRNIRQCLQDYDIPLYLKHTVTDVKGLKRLESVKIAEVDEKWKPVQGTEKEIKCDTLLLSVGLIPENELSIDAMVELDKVTGGPIVDENLGTTVDGIYACGNVLHVHDVVDYVTMEAQKVGENAAVKDKGEKCEIDVKVGDGLMYVLPQKISGKKDVKFSMRVKKPGRNKKIVLEGGQGRIREYKQVKVNPAEMIQFTVKKNQLENMEELTITLEDG